MKMNFSSIKAMIPVALILSLVLNACNAPDDVSVNRKVEEFFFAQNAESNKSSEKSLKLSDEYSELLGDRIRLKMPIGSERPTDYQMQLLYLPVRTSDVFPKDSYLIWAKDNEILTVHAFERFAPRGKDFEQTVSKMFETNNDPKRFEIKFTTLEPQQPIVIFRDKKGDNQSVFNDIYLLSAITTGSDNNLIRLQISLYALDSSRIPVFEKLAFEILKTVVSGDRGLNTQPKTILLEGLGALEMDIPDQYVNCYDGNAAQDYYRYGARKRKWEFSLKDVTAYEIVKIESYRQTESRIRLEKSDESLKDFLWKDADAQYTQDTLLGKDVEWQSVMRGDSYHAKTMIPLKSGENLCVTIQSMSRDTFSEMQNIVRTLRRK